MAIRLAAALLCGLALASCGDNGSGAGSAASGSPIASPTPTPTASYSTYAQLTGDQSFKTACSAVRNDYSPPLTVPAIGYGAGLTLSYTATSQTHILTPNAADPGLFGSSPRSYGPADRDNSASATVISYVRTTNGFVERLTIGSNAGAGFSSDYARGFSLRVPLFGTTAANATAAQYFCVFGVPTRTDDVPGGSYTYARAGLNGSAVNYPLNGGGAPETYSITQSQVSVSVSGSQLTATVRLIGALVTASGTSTTTVDLGTYTATASINAGGAYGGAVTSADRIINDATFAGGFFGPQASEASFALGFQSYDPNTGRRIVYFGTAVAQR